MSVKDFLRYRLPAGYQRAIRKDHYLCLPNATSPRSLSRAVAVIPNTAIIPRLDRNLQRATRILWSATHRIQRLPSPHQLIAPIQLHLDGAPHPQQTYIRPHAPLPLTDPVLQPLPRGRLQQSQEIRGPQVRHEGQACAGHGLVEQEPADGDWQKTESVELVEAMVHLLCGEAEQRERDPRPSGLAGGARVLEVGSEEWREVGAGLGYDEMVHVEQFGDARQRGVSLVEVVSGGDVVLGLESQRLSVRGRPGHYLAGLVFAEDGHGLVESVRGGVGGERRGPDEDVGGGEVVQKVGHAAPAGGGDGNVENALCAGVGFFEGEVADIGADAFFEDVDVEEVTFADVADGTAEEGL